MLPDAATPPDDVGGLGSREGEPMRRVRPAFGGWRRPALVESRFSRRSSEGGEDSHSGAP